MDGILGQNPGVLVSFGVARVSGLPLSVVLKGCVPMVTHRKDWGSRGGFGGQNTGILGTKRMSLGSVGIRGSSGGWDASGFAV